MDALYVVGFLSTIVAIGVWAGWLVAQWAKVRRLRNLARVSINARRV